ncbi:MAG TPA: tripartite tricarboxylate transporter substrate binding protein [Syntrophales bacterium]|jgi:tripartite-type tricarboxylate transporter receptor subunit TctC|nr:tripartite tricarboxylate transporter substrate binding protein [Syntrophales bacterium]HPX56895.1 tripartite tricarboxylate transporter substrate binding protein [Syntrophales bacterium]HQA83116.1 tripartite tricarboxylate transporter substrate binding protein [Syntrophales bacterium]
MKKRNGFIWAWIFALLIGSLVFTGGPAVAAYPERPITLLVGFAPGGSLDLSARALAASVEKILGQPVVIENKTGGTGTVALAALLSQKPDGYTLCATPSSVLIRVSQMQQVPFKPLKSFKPIIGYTTPQLGIAVKSDAPWKTLKDLVNDARKHPGKFKYATTGVGSTTHAAVEEIAAKEKVNMIHIPYKGSVEALTALMGGHVEFASLTSEFIPAVKSGQLRLLATMGEERSPSFPKVPTLKQAGYNFVNDAVYAVVAPSDLPPELAAKLEKAFTQAIKDKQYREALSKMDLVPVYYSSKNFDKFLRVNWGVINRHLISTGLIKEAATRPE